MDVKDLILPNEDSLPKIDGDGALKTSTSTGTSISMGSGQLPTITASSMTYWKFGASGIMGLLGMYYLGAGKKQSDVGKMILGAGLTLASFFLF